MKGYLKIITSITAAALLVLSAGQTLAANEPTKPVGPAEAKTLSLRSSKVLSGVELYPDVQRLELEEVRKKYEQKSAVIVDARNEYEYSTMHIKGAINIPVHVNSFDKLIHDLHASDKRPMIFYCNGLTCMKSFRAAQKAITLGEKNVFVYPYGVLSWAKEHPEDALLFDQPVKVTDIIREEDYKAKKLSPEKFSDKMIELQDKAVILDIRLTEEAGGNRLWPGMQFNIKQDNKAIQMFIDKARGEGKTLLIYDESGHQIRWVQYYMRKVGFEDYYFLDGGFENYMRMIDKDGKFVMTEYMRERIQAQREIAKTGKSQID